MALGTDYYTELFTTTLESFDKSKLVDQVLTRHPTLDLFKEEASSDTGTHLVLPLEAAEDGETAWTDASGSFSDNVSDDVAGAAEFSWSNPLVSKIRLRYLDLQKNAGSKTKIFDLVQTHLNAAQKQHARVLAEALHEDASDWSSGQIESFDRAVSDPDYDADPEGDASNDNAFFYGGIETHDGSGTLDSDKSYWGSVRTRIDGSDESSIVKTFRTVENDLIDQTSNMSDLTHIIAGRNIFEEYVDSFDDKVRYVLDGAESPAGQRKFRAVYFGDVEVRYDPDAPDDRAYFLDINTWRMKHLNSEFMKVQDTQKVPNTLDVITPIASVVALGCNERRANAVLERDADA